MKYFFLLVVTFLTLGSLSAMPFKIKGEIQGLTPGDTLYFDKVIHPGFSGPLDFKVIVEKPNEFSYQGDHKDATLYKMRYAPVSGQKVISYRTGVLMLIKDKQTVLRGNTDHIYTMDILGGLYDNDELQKILQELNLSVSNLTAYNKLLDKAQKDQDSLAIKEYTLKLRSLNENFSLEYARQDSLYQRFYDANPSSLHTVLATLQTVAYRPYDFSVSRYQKMDDNARQSSLGRALNKELDIVGRLQPGSQAPDFELTTVDGSKISLKDFTGSYVLLYHWGICPGSFSREEDIVAFQNEFKDKVAVIGITDSLLEIQEFYDNTTKDATVRGVPVHPILQSMLAHPWLETEKIEANKQMLTDYPFVSLPAFVFISPQGKIISRGSHPTFFKAKEILESESVKY